jgi:integrase
MPNTYLDKAIEAVPKFGDRISLFTKKLRLAQYADGSIYDYRLKISQAVLYHNKLPDYFTQTDIEVYLSMLMDQKRYSMSYFKHTVFGLQAYYKVMGLKEPGGLVLPKIRKPKRLPRVLSQDQIARLIHLCDLYDKALLSTIYDCALRVSEVCRLRYPEQVCQDPPLWIPFSLHAESPTQHPAAAKCATCTENKEEEVIS